jgi:zinc resistance-associated protein
MTIKNVLLRSAALPAVLLLGTLALAQTPNAAPQTSAPATQAPFGAGTGAGSGNMGQASPAATTSNATRFDARIASIKSELRLTEEQQRLWPAVETALRDGFSQHQEGMERMRSQSAPPDIAERLRLRGEMMSVQGAAMTRLADAIKPLQDKLTDDQKQRIASLMRSDRASGQGSIMRQNQSNGPGAGGYGRERDNVSNWRGRDQDRGSRRGDNESRYGRDGDNRYSGYQQDRRRQGSRDYEWQGNRRSQEPGEDAYRGYGDRNREQYGRYRSQDNYGQNGNGNRRYGNQDFGYNPRQSQNPDLFDDDPNQTED